MSFNRRTFVKRSLGASLALAWPQVVLGQKDKIYRTALIGSGWWGMNIARTAAQSRRNKIIALCDVDQRPLTKAVDEMEQLTGGFGYIILIPGNYPQDKFFLEIIDSFF